MEGDEALLVIRELGLSNFAVGLVGVLSLSFPGAVLPVAVAAGVF